MSDRGEDQDVAETEATETADAQLSAWADDAGTPRWSNIAAEAGSSGPGSAEPGPSSAVTSDSGPAAETGQPADSGRFRRPSSLRAGVSAAAEARPSSAAPQFPSSPSIPGSAQAAPAPAEPQPSVSEPSATGRRRQMPNPSELLGKLQAARLPTGNPTTGKLATDKLPTGQLKKLVRERPEVGLGLAFAGGLVLATILKRLGRR